MEGKPWWFDDLSDRSMEQAPPQDDASDLDWLLYQQQGGLHLRQAESILPAGTVRRRVDSGRWQRPARGVVVAHNGPLTREQHLWTAVLFCGEAAMLGGVRRPAQLACNVGPDPPCTS